jgi:hypothetical protein
MLAISILFDTKQFKNFKSVNPEKVGNAVVNKVKKLGGFKNPKGIKVLNGGIKFQQRRLNMPTGVR